MAQGPHGGGALKLLLDDTLPVVVAERLRARGHDVQAVGGHEPLPEREVLDLARSQGRALVTANDVVFWPLHHEAVAAGGPGDFGIVFVRRMEHQTQLDPDRVVDVLDVKLRELPGDGDLANLEISVHVVDRCAVVRDQMLRQFPFVAVEADEFHEVAGNVVVFGRYKAGPVPPWPPEQARGFGEFSLVWRWEEMAEAGPLGRVARVEIYLGRQQALAAAAETA